MSSATPASAARLVASSAWGWESVIPVTLAPYVRAAWIPKAPQPQPTSRTVLPSASASFLQTRSTLAICASSSVSSSPPRQYAQEYVMASSRKSAKKRLPTS